MGSRFQTGERINHGTGIVDHDVLHGRLVEFGGEIIMYAKKFGPRAVEPGFFVVRGANDFLFETFEEVLEPFEGFNVGHDPVINTSVFLNAGVGNTR